MQMQRILVTSEISDRPGWISRAISVISNLILMITQPYG